MKNFFIKSVSILLGVAAVPAVLLALYKLLYYFSIHVAHVSSEEGIFLLLLAGFGVAVSICLGLAVGFLILYGLGSLVVAISRSIYDSLDSKFGDKEEE